jgi:hypothetical protein
MIGTQLIKKYSTFYQNWKFIVYCPSSAEAATLIYAEADESSLRPETISLRFILLLSSCLNLGLTNGYFHLVSWRKIWLCFPSTTWVLHATPFVSSLLWSSCYNLVKSINYESSQFAILSTILLPVLLYYKISRSNFSRVSCKVIYEGRNVNFMQLANNSYIPLPVWRLSALNC